MDNLIIDSQTSEKAALFQAANIGHIGLINYLLNKGLTIDSQDEEGDTMLHCAVRRGDSTLVNYLLKRQASVFIKNKKERTALLEAYMHNHRNIISKLTQHSLEKNSIKSLLQSVGDKKKNNTILLAQFIRECKNHINENYLNRSIFCRLFAKHNKRASALKQAFDRCTSIKEIETLIKNQCALFEKRSANTISSHLLANRWSSTLKNKPKNPNNSRFYKMLNTLPKPIQSQAQRNLSNTRFSLK